MDGPDNALNSIFGGSKPKQSAANAKKPIPPKKNGKKLEKRKHEVNNKAAEKKMSEGVTKNDKNIRNVSFGVKKQPDSDSEWETDDVLVEIIPAAQRRRAEPLSAQNMIVDVYGRTPTPTVDRT